MLAYVQRAPRVGRSCQRLSFAFWVGLVISWKLTGVGHAEQFGEGLDRVVTVVAVDVDGDR
jgi:hypothetical protein